MISSNLMTGKGSLLQLFEAKYVLGNLNVKNDKLCLHSFSNPLAQILRAI